MAEEWSGDGTRELMKSVGPPEDSKISATGK